MSDVAVLILVLCAFYLHDCSLWIDRDTVVFLTRWACGRRPVFPHPLLSGGRRGLLLSFRLPPLAPVFLAYPWRVALSATHIAPLPPAELSVAATWAPGRPAVAWSAVRTVGATDNAIKVNGALAIPCQSQHRAAALADLLRNLAQCAPTDRAEAVAKALDRSMDLARLREDLATLSSAGRLLHILCNALFLHLFLVGPGLMVVFSLARLWPALVAILAILVLAIAVRYRQIHRDLWPDDRHERRSVLTHLCLYPPAAIRTYDVLAHRLCAPYHPAAVATALCDVPTRDRFLRRVLRDLHFPAARNTASEASHGTETWFRGALEAALQRMLERHGLNPAAYLLAPAQIDRSSLSYCPRCETEYAVPGGVCSDCAGVALVPFTETAVAIAGSHGILG